MSILLLIIAGIFIGAGGMLLSTELSSKLLATVSLIIIVWSLVGFILFAILGLS